MLTALTVIPAKAGIHGVDIKNGGDVGALTAIPAKTGIRGIDIKAVMMLAAFTVIPAKAGIHGVDIYDGSIWPEPMDSRFRGNDGRGWGDDCGYAG